MRGRFFLNKRTVPAFEQAIRFFEEAVREDSDYALAHCGLADASLLLARYGAKAASEVMPRAKAAARRALELDELLAEAHTSLGQAIFYYDWDAVAMERALRRAIQLNPGYAVAHHWLGFNLAELGRIAEGLTAIEEALRLDPLSLIINTNRGTIRYFGRQFERAEAELARTLELDPGFVVAHQWWGRTLGQLSRHEEALVAHRRAAELRPDDPESLAGVGYTLARLERPDEAREILARLETLARERYVPPYWPAVVLLGLGDAERTLDLLVEACEHRFDWMMALRVEPLFDPLREDARFGALLTRLGPRL